jgi:hypothetical protein
MDRLTEERIARNDAAFRSANEHIAEAAAEIHVDGALPFICECANRECNAIVMLTASEYESVRTDSRHFFNVPGHQSAAQNVGEVVERYHTYIVYEKQGHAGEVAEQLDDRAHPVHVEQEATA